VNRRQAAILAAGVFAISWAAPLIRLAGDVPSIVIAASRLTIAAPPMVGAALVLGEPGYRRLRRVDLALLLLAAAALAGHFALWVASVQRTSVTTSVVLVTMNPIFVAVGAWLFLRERPTRRVITGIGCGALGALLLAADDLGDTGTMVGNGLALGASVMASVYLVTGRGVRRRLSTAGYTGVVYSLAAVALVMLAFASGASFTGHSGEAYAYLFLIALVPQLVGHNAINYSLGTLPAAMVAVAILGEPVGAALLAAVLLDEIPSALEFTGAAIVLGGVYVALSGRRVSAEVVLAED
jgi:drug/metabolite transporter (DMT)-like permease